MHELGSILVTGASTGIGRATALRLVDLGYDVFAGIRRAEDAESLLGAVEDSKPIEIARNESARLTPIQLDVTKEAEIATARRHLGRRK